jgi:hypothetical protein
MKFIFITGLAFHEDLITPVVRQEACYIYELVLKHLRKVLPGAIATVTGGFRRFCNIDFHGIIIM